MSQNIDLPGSSKDLTMPHGEKSQHLEIEEVDVHQPPEDSTFALLSSSNIKAKAANCDGAKIQESLNKEVRQ